MCWSTMRQLKWFKFDDFIEKAEKDRFKSDRSM